MKNLLGTVAVSFAVIFSAESQQPQATKPPIGIPTDALAFNGKFYRGYLESVSWRRAKEKCASLGGQLAIVPDKPTWAFTQQIAKGLMLWLGATDEKTEGLWVWVDGAEMKFKAWGPDRPNNGGRKEHYLHTLPDGHWNDITDTTPLVVGFICEWKAK